MVRGLILLFATVLVFAAPGVRGTFHLSFANNTQVNITRNGCGTTKLCVETPDGCDPAGNGTCLFTSVTATPPVAPNGTILDIELSGNSTGYIAVGLTANSSEGKTMLFVCAQNNGSFFFRTIARNNSNNMLYPVETIVREIRGMVKGDLIQCEFQVPNVNATSTRSATNFNVLIGSGTTTGTNLGPFMVALDSGPLNIANPTSNLAMTPAPTTPSVINATTPSNVTVTTPSNVTVTTPGNITVTTPSNVTVTTPSNITVTTPSNITVTTPSNVTVTTPSNITVTTMMMMTSGASGAVLPHAVLLLLSVLILS